jgi:hypothetical protein
MNYFSGCETIEDVKKAYRAIMLEIHPDNLTRLTAEVNEEYEAAIRSRRDVIQPASEPMIINYQLITYLYLLRLGMRDSRAREMCGMSDENGERKLLR